MPAAMRMTPMMTLTFNGWLLGSTVLLPQLHPLASQPVEHRRLVVRAAVAAQIAIPKIVRQNEQDIRPRDGGRLHFAAQRHGGSRAHGRPDELPPADLSSHDG